MPKTYEPIATYTVPSAGSGYTFTSIPSTYTDLVLVVTSRSTSGGTSDGLALRFNSDTAANYSATILRGDGTSALSSRNSSDTFYRIASYGQTASGSAANTFSTVVIHIMNYANTTTNKTAITRANVASDGTAAVVGLWRQTSAITSVSVLGYSGNIDTGSTFTLYGIKNA
jgi:hypothetical protein